MAVMLFLNQNLMSQTEHNDIVAHESTALTLYGTHVGIGGISKKVPEGENRKVRMVRISVKGQGNYDLAEGDTLEIAGRTYALARIRKSWFQRRGKIVLRETS